MTAPLLSVQGLGVAFGGVPVTQDMWFDIQPGERVGMVGESGCGKSVTGLALLRLLPAAARLSGRVVFEGQDVLRLPARALRRVRGGRIGMIFQEPMTALDPVFTVGEQIAETLRAHLRLGRKAAAERAVALLDAVGIPSPRARAASFPHQLSGGMRQRAMIAVAIACEPALLIADEPTTALDVTVQAQIVDLLLALSERNGTALLFVTHDLGVIAEACTRVLTLYAGQVVEDAPADTMLLRPRHPYTAGLLRSLPRLSPRKTRLPSIPGRVPSPLAMPDGCRFAPRCPHALPPCAEPQPPRQAGAGTVRCCRAFELALHGASHGALQGAA